MEIIKNEKKVTIVSKESWKYGEVSETSLKELNEALYNEIQKEVDYAVDNEALIKEQQAKEKEEQAKKELQVRISKFKELIYNNPETMKVVEDEELILVFPNVEARGYVNPNSVTIKSLKCSSYMNCELEYNNKVYAPGAWHPHTTDKVWELSFDHKRTRYSNLQNAFKKAAEKINDYIAEQKRKDQEKNKETFQEDEMRKFAEDNGFSFDKEYHSSKYSNGWYSYNMIKETDGKAVKVKIAYNEKDEKVVIIEYKMSHKNITVAEINKLF